MDSSAVEAVERQAEQLAYDEQLALIERLVAGLRERPGRGARDLEALRRMAGDPEIRRELAAIEADFAASSADGA